MIYGLLVMANSVFHVKRDGPKKVSVMRDRHPLNLVCYHGNLMSSGLFLENNKKNAILCSSKSEK